ncbi:hypothetical protein [Bradyrhizobium sp.]|uniref:hypothetical protein n=1 Tax=Bradyrhizobium sp. TaxID=376 RepID=UPI003C709286
MARHCQRRGSNLPGCLKIESEAEASMLDDVWSSTKHEKQPFTYGSGGFLFCGGEVTVLVIARRASDEASRSVIPGRCKCIELRCAIARLKSGAGAPSRNDRLCNVVGSHRLHTTTLSRFAARVMPV